MTPSTPAPQASDKLISTLVDELQSAMYFCAGAALDPAVPAHTREALRDRESRISDLLERIEDDLP